MLGFAFAAAVAFELDGHMMDAELPLEHLRHIVQDAIVVGLGGHDRVRG